MKEILFMGIVIFTDFYLIDNVVFMQRFNVMSLVIYQD